MTSPYNFHPLQLFVDAVNGDEHSHSLVRENIEIAHMAVHVLELAYHGKR